ncbi:MAG: TIGR02757 family protein [Flavitalea sp.]
MKEYNQPSFIACDPVSVPHQFSKKQDIEIAGFFAAIFAWGNRTTIINKSMELMKMMNMSPHDFIIHHSEKDLRKLEGFCHRTFNTTDLLYFIHFLTHHYTRFDSLEEAFVQELIPAGEIDDQDMFIERMLNRFRHYFFSLEDFPPRTRKHIAAPERNSSCKRINMYLRWMVRKDNQGVDFGLWEKISPAKLICPIDLHVARVAKKFKLLDRKQADWQAAVSLTRQLRHFDASDPVKYDFALFALGAIEKF